MARQSLLTEFLEFLRTEKWRWLTPIALAALLLGLFFVLLQWRSISPFIYRQF